MPSIKKNVIANFIGKVWATLISLLLVPLYIKYLGIEAYGLIGFYITLTSTLSFLDFGLTTTLNRELARAKAMQKDVCEVRNLVFTIESIYWIIGIATAGLIVVLSPVIANHWINAQHLPQLTVSHSIMLMGAIIAFQWPISIYTGGLLGLEKQVNYNIAFVVMHTIRATGVFLIFYLIKPSIELFFVWQAGITCLYVFSMRLMLWNNLPSVNSRPKFSLKQLKDIWKFAAGMTGVYVITFFLSQFDKIILSKLLPLATYGYYMLSFTVASVIQVFIFPINTAIFPRLSAFLSVNKKEDLRFTFHSGCKLIATLAFPTALVLIFFAPDILFVWTKDVNTVSNASLLVRLLTIGTLLNCLMVIPSDLLFADGNTRFVFYQNLIAVVVLLPLLMLLVKQFNAIGATFIPIIYNVALLTISNPIILFRYFKGEQFKWYLNDTIIPLVPPLVTIISIKLILHYFLLSIKVDLIALIEIATLVMAASLFFYSPFRALIFSLVFKRKKVLQQIIE
jgi:O-antigen/teichoic acid export membrane protein